MLSTEEQLFAKFGPSNYLRRTASCELELPTTYAEVRSQLRASCPEMPGVYGMIDCAGRLIYVGMSRCLRKRTLTYFQDTHGRQSGSWRNGVQHRKESNVAVRAKRLTWETTNHELLALLREQELIRRFAPEMNVRGRRRKPLVYVFLSLEAAPRFKVAAQLPKACRHHWGPVARSGYLLRNVETLNRTFLLADCAPDVCMRFSDEPPLFDLELYPQCLRGQVNRCLAPCAGTITRAAYQVQLKRAQAFLNGHEDAILDELERNLQAAVKNRRFEQAAAIHDTRSHLIDLREQLLHRPATMPASFVYSFTLQDRVCWLAAHEGRVMKVAVAPRNARSAALWRDRLNFYADAVLPVADHREGSELSILAAWFRRHPGELEHVVDYAAARKRCATF